MQEIEEEISLLLRTKFPTSIIKSMIISKLDLL